MFLIRMHQNGIPCPEVVLVKKHVILMSFIGRNSIPAPQLRQAKLSTKNQQIAYQQVCKVKIKPLLVYNRVFKCLIHTIKVILVCKRFLIIKNYM